MIYFDNAATSYPKPQAVTKSIQDYLADGGCSPGRSGHTYARASEDRVEAARKNIANFFGVKTASKLTYTYNATYALNMVIKGYLKENDHVIATCLEHNSVLRPLHKLSTKGLIEYSILGLDSTQTLDVHGLKKLLKPNTRLIAVTHASNVTGQINPIEKIVEIAHEHNIKVLVDLSQTAGHLDIDLEKLDVDFAVFTGHKALFGLPGIGGMYVKDFNDLDTILEGGTGNNSVSLFQPELPPHKFEAGTINYTGIIGLSKGVDYIKKFGLKEIEKVESEMIEMVIDGLKDNPKVGLIKAERKRPLPVLSLNISGMPSNILADVLDAEYQIMTRPGLQCAPLAHKALGTYPNGTLRVSLSMHNTKEECSKFIDAIQEISQRDSMIQ